MAVARASKPQRPRKRAFSKQSDFEERAGRKLSLRNLWAGLGGAAIGAMVAGFAVHLSDTSEISRLSAAQAATDAKLQDLQTATNEQKGDKASFAAAVAKDLDQEGLLCLGFEKFPVDVFRNGDTIGVTAHLPLLGNYSYTSAAYETLPRWVRTRLPQCRFFAVVVMLESNLDHAWRRMSAFPIFSVRKIPSPCRPTLSHC